jgi:hypothetical protein
VRSWYQPWRKERAIGRISTWVLVAAVAALGLVATVDALQRGDDGAPATVSGEPAAKPPENQAAWRRAAADELREEAVRGTLLLMDERCRIRLLQLPDVDAPIETAAAGPCAEGGAPGVGVGFGGEARAPTGEVSARCRNGRGQLLQRGVVRGEFPGCAPAWRPDGALTFVVGGELARLRACGEARPCVRVLVSRREIARVFSHEPWLLERPVLTEVAWLDEDTFAAIVRDRARAQYVVGVFRGRRLVGAPPFVYGRLTGLRASPYGSFAAARGDTGSIVLLDAEGDLRPDGLSGAHAIAWSPDETWTAMARRDAVYLFETGTRAVRLIRLPIAVADLDWR